MATLHVSFHIDAVAEAREARQWYEERWPALAEAFMTELDHAVQQITELPDTWPPYEQGTRRYLMQRFPYFVIYRQRGVRIDVVAVMHARRSPGYWHHR